MNNEFPDPEDEFDIEHEDEYEVLRELEAVERGEVIPNKPSSTQKPSTQPIINSNSQVTNGSIVSQNTQLNDLAVIETAQSQSKTTAETTKKRSIDQILQESSAFDINDSIDLDNLGEWDHSNTHKKKKLCWDQTDEVIKLVLDRRKALQNGINNNGITGNVGKSTYDKSKSITTRVPRYEFIALTRTEDGNRIYIKVSDKNHYVPKTYKTSSTSGFLIKSFNHLKDEAENILLKINQKDDLEILETSNQAIPSCELWVDKYRPKRYLELLSDENVNKSLLYWLKLWDKIVFDRDPTVRSRKPQTFSRFKGKFKKKEDVPDHDSKGFPTQRIALLTGPPGLGKTTLAHIAARHAGYNIVELNASDDRGPEAFREALLASTQMRAVIDQDRRPNCLVLDEIDGAPAASIDLLLKFIHGKLAPKGKNAKKNQKENDGCRRPIICICNDLYTPSLRPLRTMALVLNVPEISAVTLSERLSEIARKENLYVDSKALLELAQRSACDVRACLGILQYTGGKTDMLKNLAFGLKDMRKGLFESWKELLQVPMTRKGVLTDAERVRKVVKVVHQGEPERLMQGIFHNYTEICKDKIAPVAKSMDWFGFYDEIHTLVMERQTWMLMPYTMSAFVAWHLYLSGTQVPKISFPSAALEVNQKLERNKAILTITKKVSKYDILTLVAEVLPYLPDLLTPKLRSVNAQLYTAVEKENLDRLVNLMLDFGLTFTQEKRPEGGYEFVLDPNVWDIGTFPGGKPRRQLPYAVKQIVIQELESARIRRSAVMNGEEVAKKPSTAEPSTSSKSKTAAPAKSSTAENLPNHLKQQLNPLEITPKNDDKRCRNFFQAFQAAGKEKLEARRAKDREMGIVSPEIQSKAERDKQYIKSKMDLIKCDVTYHYNEGYTNAVRRKVLMKDLL